MNTSAVLTVDLRAIQNNCRIVKKQFGNLDCTKRCLPL